MQLSNDQIRQILPHRHPFLLVDKILDYQPGEWARGIKCVSANEMLFLGHFPDQSIFPGVLLLEAMAQTGAIAILTKEEHRGKLAMFGGVKQARFLQPVLPGDVVELECQLVRFLGTVGKGQATAKVGDVLVASAEFTFALRDQECYNDII